MNSPSNQIEVVKTHTYIITRYAWFAIFKVISVDRVMCLEARFQRAILTDASRFSQVDGAYVFTKRIRQHASNEHDPSATPLSANSFLFNKRNIFSIC